jgi:hypothetical protein
MDFLYDIILDKETHHSSEGASDEDSREENTCRHSSAVCDNCEQVPDNEVDDEWLVVEHCLLVHEDFDD